MATAETLGKDNAGLIEKARGFFMTTFTPREVEFAQSEIGSRRGEAEIIQKLINTGSPETLMAYLSTRPDIPLHLKYRYVRDACWEVATRLRIAYQDRDEKLATEHSDLADGFDLLADEELAKFQSEHQSV